jgi:amidase
MSEASVSEKPSEDATDAPWRWSASRMARAIRDRTVSSEEVVSSCLQRIDAVNGTLNALVEVSHEEAFEAARVADAMVAAGQALGPLHGVPTAIKINTDQAGHATTDGIVAMADAIAAEDSPQTRLLRQAGAVFVGRSNSPAFGFRWFANNALHGSTLNPWDATRTPGGSSGGAASAVASGMVAIGQGNDIGGSVRYPAYACGVAGIRPTVGRVAGHVGPPGLDSPPAVQMMAVQGPIARTVDDLRLAFAAMSGYDPKDPVAVPGAPAAAPARRPLKVGVVASNAVASPTPAVDAALRTAANWLADAAYEVQEVQLPLLEEAYRLWWLLVMEDFRLLMPLVEQMGDDGMKTAASHYYQVLAEWWGEQPSLEDYIKGYARRGTLIAQLQTFLEEYPIVLLPVSAEQAFEQDADVAGVERCRQLIAAQYSMMAVPLLGFPAVSVPTGIEGGLPVGVQLLGRRFDDATLLDAGNVIEACAGTFTPIDPR